MIYKFLTLWIAKILNVNHSSPISAFMFGIQSLIPVIEKPPYKSSAGITFNSAELGRPIAPVSATIGVLDWIKEESKWNANFYLTLLADSTVFKASLGSHHHNFCAMLDWESK